MHLRLNEYARKTALMIFCLALFRLFLAFVLELGNDEAYYWMYSQVLQPNYFDHPPGVALLIRLCTLNGMLSEPGPLRLGAVLGSSLSAWFLYKAVATMHSNRAGFYAAVLYNASFYAGLTAGVYIMPDSAQMIFWTAALWQLARIMHDDRNWNYWLLFALAAGAAIMSKVHGAFLCSGLAVYVLVHRRSWLMRPQLYVAALLILLTISPILAWNLKHDFITYRFHSRRVTVDHFNLRFSYMLKELVGQFVFNNPVTVVLILVSLVRWKSLPEKGRDVLVLFNWIALPHAAFLILVSLFRDTTLPHWSGPAYVTLIPLAAIRLSLLPARRYLPVALRAALGLYLLTLTGWLLVVKSYPGTYGKKDQEQLGTGDISLDLYGWKAAGARFSGWYTREVGQGRIAAGTPVTASYWWGAHLHYYFCRPAGIPFRATGPVSDIREYYWRQEGEPLPPVALAISASDEHYELPDAYPQRTLLYTITVIRAGKPSHRFSVYRLQR